jgi:hypothetical protein
MKGISPLSFIAAALCLTGCASSTASSENQYPASNPPATVASSGGIAGGALDVVYTGAQAITNPEAFSGSGEPAKRTYPPDP